MLLKIYKKKIIIEIKYKILYEIRYKILYKQKCE